MPNEFDDNQYYQYGPYPHMHPPYHHHPPYNHFCPDPRNLVVPIISTIGAGPKGDRGEAGVLKFGRDGEDSVLWDNTYAYDVGTFVIHDGISYVSIKDVPAGVEITDENYWMHVGNENVPYEQLTRDLNLEKQARIAGDNDLNDRLLQEIADRTAKDNDLAGDLAEEVNARIAGDKQNADDIDAEEAARAAEDLAIRALIQQLSDKIDAMNITVKELHGTVLYDNQITATDWEDPSVDFTVDPVLSDDAANYEYLEVFYVDRNQHYMSLKVNDPDGKVFAIFTVTHLKDTNNVDRQWTDTKSYKINGRYIRTYSDSRGYHAGNAEIYHQIGGEDRKTITITKVVGYKYEPVSYGSTD